MAETEEQVVIDVPPRPSLVKRVTEGLAFGATMAAIVIGSLLGLDALTGPSRQEQILIASAKGLRCILRDAREDQPTRDQQALFNRCYGEFDRLVRGE